MRRKPPEIQFEQEASAQIAAVKAKVGQAVPLSMRYSLGPRATLVALDGETATLVFPNGARLENMPLRDLVDDSGYWKR